PGPGRRRPRPGRRRRGGRRRGGGWGTCRSQRPSRPRG
ncbi:MAG: hypothetical protein AVDCRST_MAG13-1343, partial [uncultured Solirubrobacteraceae bacterium]